MGLIFSWWLVIEILGLVGMPLAALVFARLPDRGWALSKPFSLLIVGWLVWFPLSVISALPYSGLWIVLTFLAFALFNAALLYRDGRVRADLRRLVTQNPLYIAASELVFTFGFLLLAWIRSLNPTVAITEKFMDVAFLSSLWRAQHLPPPDPWLSGAPINYYYFGHFLLASIAKVLNTQPGTAFNLGIAVIFGLVATAVFGVASDITTLMRPPRNLQRALPFGLFSMAMVLLLGNLDSAALWWREAVAWTKTVAGSGQSPFAWFLHRDLWNNFNLFWGPSRVISGTINEFPTFSFALSDLHAHVLALPFAAVAVAVALNVLLGRDLGIRALGRGWHGIISLLAAAIAIGSLYVINGWDLPTYLGLALLALAFQQWHAHGRRYSRLFLLDLGAPALILVALTFLLYLPFYREFVSPSQGIGLVPVNDRSPIGQEIAIFGLQLFLALSLLFLWGVREFAPRVPTRVSQSAPATLLAGLGLGSVSGILVLWTIATRQSTGWTLLWCLLLVAFCIALALGRLLPAGTFPSAQRAELFLLLLIGTSFALVGVCEVVFVRDIFNDRMNTVFKLYYQAWLLLGICGGPTLLLLLGAARRRVEAAFAALIEPVMAAPGYREWREVAPGLFSVRGTSESVTVATSVAGRPNLESGSAAGAAGQAGEVVEQALPARRWTGQAKKALPPQLHWLGAAGILVWTGILVLLIGAALIYPVLAASVVTNNFTPASGSGLTLDGTAFMATQPANVCTPCSSCPAYAGTDLGDNDAILWLNTHVQGSPVILEAPGCEWSYYSRVSAFTGLPTLIGWPGGHEGEWRINWLPEQHQGDILGARAVVANEIYTNPNQGTVLALLRQYHVRYVYVGYIERELYTGTNLDRFGTFLHLVYRRGGVSIYAVP
jgi:YYY domain-containing protein